MMVVSTCGLRRPGKSQDGVGNDWFGRTSVVPLASFLLLAFIVARIGSQIEEKPNMEKPEIGDLSSSRLAFAWQGFAGLTLQGNGK